MFDNGAAEQIQCIGDSVIENFEGAHDELCLEGVVLVSGKEKQLKVTHKGLTLGVQVTSTKNIKTKDLSFTWQDVICAVSDMKSPSGQKISSFKLHYIQQQNSNKLQAQSVNITDKDGQAEKWINTINEKCRSVSGRPKTVFVIVNPIGGARRGRHIYQKAVAPLFELAGMNLTVTFTEKSKHALELSEHQDFSGYDTIVIVGGDGLYQEVLCGLTIQLQKNAGVNYDNPDSVFTKPDIAFGIIPAGTGNGIAQWCNGIVDEVTAALTIIRGKKRRAQIFTVHSDGKFITLGGLCFGYGEFSDLMKRTDELRWMGRMRYPYAIIGVLVKRPRMFNCEIEYCVADNEKNQDAENSSSIAGAQGAEWRVYTGNCGSVCGLAAATCEQIKKGNDFFCSPYGNSVDLLVDFGAGRIDLFKTIGKWMTGKNAAGPMPPKLDCISRITGFRIKLVHESDATASAARNKAREMEKILDIDGEVVHIDKPEFDIRVRSNFVPLYGRLELTDGAAVM